MRNKPLFYVPILTLGAFIIVLLVPAFVPNLIDANEYYSALLALLIVNAIFIAHGYLTYNRISHYRITYSDNRKIGGDVEVTYTNTKNSKAKQISVKELKLKPDTPLQTSGWAVVFNFKETTCSLQIIPKVGNYSLILGFPTLQELNWVYHEFGGLDSSPR
ncbi:MAG TPA: hypothetical protein VJN71_07360 [Nitrososphaerales archaeon]|nr:hypothetical protein [Nitrososphaerales archaeon]